MKQAPIENYLSLGYVIARRTRRPVDHYPELRGEPIVPVSQDLTELLPDTWCFHEEDSDGARAIIGNLGLEERQLDGLREWFRHRLQDDAVVWPSRFRSPAAAREGLESFLAGIPAKSEMCVLGLGVTQECAEEIHKEVERETTPGARPYIPEFEILRGKHPLDKSGEALGFEILCFFTAGGISCSWYCNYLHQEAEKRFGITPGRLGLIEKPEDAEKIAAFCNLPETAAEPGLWIPVLLVEYTHPSLTPDLPASSAS